MPSKRFLRVFEKAHVLATLKNLRCTEGASVISYNFRLNIRVKTKQSKLKVTFWLFVVRLDRSFGLSLYGCVRSFP